MRAAASLFRAGLAPPRSNSNSHPHSQNQNAAAIGPRIALSRLPARPLQRSASPFPRLSAAAAPSDTAAAAPSTAPHDALLRWCIEQRGLPPTPLEPELLDSDLGTREVEIGFTIASDSVPKESILLEIPGDLAATAVDVAKDPVIAPLAEGRGELVGLALLLMQERSKGEASVLRPLLATLPQRTETPVLWPDAERGELLRGSPVLAESRAREAALGAEWDAIEAVAAAASSQLPPGFSRDAFFDAMSVVVAAAAYLPSAQCFALLPVVGSLRRTGSAAGATLDYDLDRQAVTLVAARPYTRGQEVRLFDGRPSGEVLLSTGKIEPANPADFLTLPASLVPADRLYQQKREVLAEMGFGPSEEFPIFEDRMATQHLTYMRLARLTDAAQFARITFDDDVIVSVENEYEVLQLLMADLRDRMQAYTVEYEDDLKVAQRRDLGHRERLAAVLRLAERRVLRGTMTGVRRRLAPIRGIPTKAGTLQDPNADFKEMFDVLESIPAAPKRLFDGLTAWARGENDPDWKKKSNKPPR